MCVHMQELAIPQVLAIRTCSSLTRHTQEGTHQVLLLLLATMDRAIHQHSSSSSGRTQHSRQLGLLSSSSSRRLANSIRPWT